MSPFRSHDKTAGLSWLLHAAGLGITIGLLLLGFRFVHRPVNTERSRIATQIEAAQADTELLSDVLSQRDALERSLDENQRRHSLILTRVPEIIGESEFLAHLTDLGDSSGITISRYHPGLPVHGTEYASLDVEIEIHAPYPNLARFLSGLHELPRLCRTTALQVDAPEVGGTECRVIMTLRIYYLLPAARTVDEVTHG